MRYKLCLIVLAFAILGVGVKVHSIETAPEAGKYAPAFDLKDMNGKKVSLSEFKGKVVLLNFWATTCDPCKAEMPSMNNLYKTFRDHDFTVLAISIDTSEKAVKSFISEKGISFPVLLDRNKEVYFDDYAVIGLPTSFLIDRNGVIAEKFLGERDWDSPEMKNKITSLLNRR